MSKQAIIDHWLDEHNNVTEAYKNGTPYRGKVLSVDDFQKIHDFIWFKLEQKLIVDGHQPDFFDDVVGKPRSIILEENLASLRTEIPSADLLIEGLEDKKDSISIKERTDIRIE